MKNKKSWSKKIILAEGIFVIGILVYLFFSTAPSQTYPISGMAIMEPDFIFEVEEGEQVIISVDENFKNSFILEEGAEIDLPPGVYYYKIKNLFRESEVQTFEIKGNVAMTIHEAGEDYEVSNIGNVGLEVSKKNDTADVEFDLEIGESEQFKKDNSNYEGKQK